MSFSVCQCFQGLLDTLCAECLEERALTKSANKDAFNSILQEFEKEVSEDISKKLTKIIFLQTNMVFLPILNIKQLQVKW